MSVADIDPLELLTKKQAAARTGFSEHTLDRHRKEGKGIPYVRIGRTIRYRSTDVAKYLAEHRVEPEKPRSHKPAPQPSSRWPTTGAHFHPICAVVDFGSSPPNAVTARRFGFDRAATTSRQLSEVTVAQQKSSLSLRTIMTDTTGQPGSGKLTTEDYLANHLEADLAELAKSWGQTADATELERRTRWLLRQLELRGMDNPFDNRKVPPSAPQQTAEGVAGDDPKRNIEKWAARRYPINALDGLPYPWARTLSSRIARKNADRDPTKFPPTLIFQGDTAVAAGATNTAELAALGPELRPDQIRELRLQEASALEADRAQVRRMAKEAVAAEAAAGLDIPEPLNLATYTPPPVNWMLDGLLPVGASLGLFAERKAGKTSTTVEMVRSLTAGDRFLGRFQTRLSYDARVVHIDTEMTDTMMQHEFRKIGTPEAHLGRVDFYGLRGRSSLLDMRDTATRQRWGRRIIPGSVIVVDCLYTVFSALSIDENSGAVADVINGFKALAVECDAGALILVHHLSKDATRGARGHSSLEGAVDTIVTIQLAGPPGEQTPRTFEAAGRMDVFVEPTTLLRGEDLRLQLAEGSPREHRRRSQEEADDELVFGLVQSHPGCSLRILEALPRSVRGELSRERISKALKRLDGIRLENAGTAARPKWEAIDGGACPFALP